MECQGTMHFPHQRMLSGLFNNHKLFQVIWHQFNCTHKNVLKKNNKKVTKEPLLLPAPSGWAEGRISIHYIMISFANTLSIKSPYHAVNVSLWCVYVKSWKGSWWKVIIFSCIRMAAKPFIWRYTLKQSLKMLFMNSWN